MSCAFCLDLMILDLIWRWGISIFPGNLYPKSFSFSCKWAPYMSIFFLGADTYEFIFAWWSCCAVLRSLETLSAWLYFLLALSRAGDFPPLPNLDWLRQWLAHFMPTNIYQSFCTLYSSSLLCSCWFFSIIIWFLLWFF